MTTPAGVRKSFTVQVNILMEECDIKAFGPGEEAFYTIRFGNRWSDDLHGPFVVGVKDNGTVTLTNTSGVTFPAFKLSKIQYYRRAV